MKNNTLLNTVITTLCAKRLHVVLAGLLVMIFLETTMKWIKDSHYFFYEALTIIVCAGYGINDTYRSVRVRILATIFGLIVGTVMAFIQPMNAWFAIAAYILIYYIAERFNWQEFIGIAGVVFLVVYFYHNATNNENVFVYAAWRLLHTVIGALIVLGLSYIYLKNDTSENEELCARTTVIAENLFILVADVIRDEKKSYRLSIDRLQQDIVNIKKQREALLLEEKVKNRIDARLNYLKDIIDAMDDMRIFLYFLSINAYYRSQWDEETCERVNKEYGTDFYRKEEDIIIYVNSLAVRKLLEKQNRLKASLTLLSADDCLEREEDVQN